MTIGWWLLLLLSVLSTCDNSASVSCHNISACCELPLACSMFAQSQYNLRSSLWCE